VNLIMKYNPLTQIVPKLREKAGIAT